MRQAPSEERVFQISLLFVGKAGKTTDDDAMVLAQDVHRRAESLIPYQPLNSLKKARQDHTRVGEELFPIKKASNSEDPFVDAEALLKAAQQAEFPNFAKARLLHEVEAELANQVRRVL